MLILRFILTIGGMVLAFGAVGYFTYPAFKNRQENVEEIRGWELPYLRTQIAAGAFLFAAGVLFLSYMIKPEEQNSFVPVVGMIFGFAGTILFSLSHTTKSSPE